MGAISKDGALRICAKAGLEREDVEKIFALRQEEILLTVDGLGRYSLDVLRTEVFCQAQSQLEQQSERRLNQAAFVECCKLAALLLQGKPYSIALLQEEVQDGQRFLDLLSPRQDFAQINEELRALLGRHFTESEQQMLILRICDRQKPQAIAKRYRLRQNAANAKLRSLATRLKTEVDREEVLRIIFQPKAPNIVTG